MSVPIVGGDSLRNFESYVKTQFDGNIQRAVVSLICGIPPVTKADQLAFLPKLDPETKILAMLLDLRNIAMPMFIDFMAQKEAIRQWEEQQVQKQDPPVDGEVVSEGPSSV